MKLPLHLLGSAVLMTAGFLWARDTYDPTFGVPAGPVLLALGGFGWMVAAVTAAWLRHRN